MKFFRFVLIFCVVILFSYTSFAADAPQKRSIQIIPKSTPAPDSIYQENYAVIIGISAYHEFPTLEHAVKDARAMEEKLRSLDFETTVLIDDQASKESILKVLGDELPRKVQQNDRVIIFFAGLTQTEELADGTQMGYFIPADAAAENIFSTSISMDQIREISGRLKADHVLYLIDSCFAGLALTASGTIPSTDPNYLQKITVRKAHQMLIAGGNGESVQRIKDGLSVFTVFVLEGIDGWADREGKGFITFSDLASYVKQRVTRFAMSKQVPQYGNIMGEGEVIFALRGAPKVQQIEIPGYDQDRQQVAEKMNLSETDEQGLAAKQAQMKELTLLDKKKRGAQAALQELSIPIASEIERDGRFIAYDNGTVLDTETNLMWAAKDNGTNINWQNAKNYCESYRSGGYSDWRMPRQDELAGLYDETITNTNPPAVGCKSGYHVTRLIHLTCCCSWALETRGTMASYFGFNSGLRSWQDESYVGSLRALPVRVNK